MDKRLHVIEIEGKEIFYSIDDDGRIIFEKFKDDDFTTNENDDTKEEYKERNSNRLMIPGHIYFIQCNDGVYKIGRTKNLKQRMNDYSKPKIILSIYCTNINCCEDFVFDSFMYDKNSEGKGILYHK